MRWPLMAAVGMMYQASQGTMKAARKSASAGATADALGFHLPDVVAKHARGAHLDAAEAPQVADDEIVGVAVAVGFHDIEIVGEALLHEADFGPLSQAFAGDTEIFHKSLGGTQVIPHRDGVGIVESIYPSRYGGVLGDGASPVSTFRTSAERTAAVTSKK